MSQYRVSVTEKTNMRNKTSFILEADDHLDAIDKAKAIMAETYLFRYSFEGKRTRVDLEG